MRHRRVVSTEPATAAIAGAMFRNMAGSLVRHEIIEDDP